MATLPAIREALKTAGLGAQDIDRWEIYESSAAAMLAWLVETGVPDGKVNPDGGALATTAPLGAVGAGLFAAAVNGIAEGGSRRAVVAVAGDPGIAAACVLEGVLTIHSCGRSWGVSHTCNFSVSKQSAVLAGAVGTAFAISAPRHRAGRRAYWTAGPARRTQTRRRVRVSEAVARHEGDIVTKLSSRRSATPWPGSPTWCPPRD